MDLTHTRRSARPTRSVLPAGLGRGSGPRAAVACGVVLLAGVNLYGLSYYLAPLAVRMRHPMHAAFRPSGSVGQTLGLVAIALFLFLWLYPIRKRYGSRLAFTGPVSSWLDWHVAAGLLAPWVAATHAGWRFTGLIGMGYAAMFIVYASGLIGRYLYTSIPRRRDGVELTREEMAGERERLLFELTAETGLPPDEVRSVLADAVEVCTGLGPVATLSRLVRDDLARRRSARALARRIAGSGRRARPLDAASLAEVIRLARREMSLAQQARMLDATHRLFRYWHVAHRPVAVTALLAVLAHIAVAAVMGFTWLM